MNFNDMKLTIENTDIPTPETDKNALLLANLDDWIDDCLRNSKPIGLTLCDARKRISDQSDRIAELWDAMEIIRRERDEAREIINTNFEEISNKLAVAMRERDEAMAKVEQQRKEIVRLNGATSHAGGTPLKIALRERDEARSLLKSAQSALDAIHLEVGAWIKTMKYNTD